MEEWNTDYIDELKKHYVVDVVNALLAHATQYEYTRLYPLLALVKLADKQNPHKQFLYTEILDKAKELGYTGSDDGIKWGLHAIWESGMVENEGDEKGSYWINPRFRKALYEAGTDLKSTLNKLKTNR
ncbi:MAG: hypothetical protein ACYDAZ_06405 [Thermoplasmataceae archaeon]